MLVWLSGDFWCVGMCDRIKNGLGMNKSIDYGVVIGFFIDLMVVCWCIDGDYWCFVFYFLCFWYCKNFFSDKYLVGIFDVCRMLVVDFLFVLLFVG